MTAAQVSVADVRSRVADGRIQAVLFDLDGVITDTAAVHAAAWKSLFDDFLKDRAEGRGFRPFRVPEDYLAHVDGEPRYDGVRDFLRARGIVLPEGSPSDPADRITIRSLGDRKDALFNAALADQGVRVFGGSVALIAALRRRGVATACVSSSRNCRPVLARCGLLDVFDAIVDGQDIDRGLAGKPAPDSYLQAARNLGVPPPAAAVVEDALSGVAAGHTGGFGLVIGLDRGVGRAALLERGADIVVGELDEFLPLDEG